MEGIGFKASKGLGVKGLGFMGFQVWAGFIGVKVEARKLEHHSPPALKVKSRGSQHKSS